ncbi:sigma-70 family RNA polymerase sigma factor [Chryseolinea lacunae]|uniref:RNA polymerase sigma factor n=1 Tax=Chryseolinea lacunae TaxID=2801331 RepID=A0ABS1KYW5_9BACT|nr:sigma-70 family RNA polymerase sigma factor [Chryseolinea lacunae]MBL0744661.1 sigma-70 family RNA polymerase sigma factor [Chryseolinea lacunae]
MNSIAISDWLKTQNELRAFVYKKVRDKALAEDIVQDVYLKVYTHISSLKESDSITAWIYRITRNVISDHFRKQSKTLHSFELDWENQDVNYNECVSSCLKDMLHQLPSKYREAIELTEFHNLSQLQLAERLQISYSGAKSRVQRARQILREKMDIAYHIQHDAYGNAIACQSRLACGCE